MRLSLAFWITASVALPALVLLMSAPEARTQAGLPRAPFCSIPLLMVHLIAVVPLSMYLAGRIGLLSRKSAVMVSLTMALVAVGATISWSPTFAALLEVPGLGLPLRLLLRTVLCLFFVTSILGVSGWSREIDVLRLPLVVGLIVALGVPGALAYRQSETRLQEASKHLDSGRLAKALVALEFLSELGSNQTLKGKSPAALAQSVRSDLDRLELQRVGGLPEGSTRRARLDLAFVSLQLNDYAGAERLLAGDVQAGDPDAMLLLAAALRDQGRGSECEQLYRRILKQFQTYVKLNAKAREACDASYDGLVDLLKSEGRSSEAGRLLVEARTTIPGRAAYYTLRMGAHSLDVGRPAEALTLLNEAVRLDSRLLSQVRPLIRQARVKTPACLIAK